MVQSVFKILQYFYKELPTHLQGAHRIGSRKDGPNSCNDIIRDGS